MSEVELRIPAHLTDPLLKGIRRRGMREPVVFGLASHAKTATRDLVLVREVVIPPERAYLASNGHGARWSGAYSIELLNRSSDVGCGLLVFHEHGHAGPVRLSADDVSSARALLPRFQLVHPTRPHGSIVLGHDSTAGLLLLPGSDEPVPLGRVRAWGCWDYLLDKLPVSDSARAVFAHQPLLVGPVARELLRRTRVAVVGLSGGGSQVAVQLAAMNVGEIVGIDPQRVDSENEHGTPSFNRLDRWLRLRKTTSARIRAWLISPRTRFRPVNCAAAEPDAVTALKDADVIVGCVNNLHGRADVQDIATRYCIPYVDIGMRISCADGRNTDGHPPSMTGIPGNVFVSIPGEPCLWCTDFITESKLDGETGGKGRSYLEGMEGASGFVASFNGVLASEAAAEVLHLVLGYAQAPARAVSRRYDGLDGTITECLVSRRPGCPNCDTVLAAGDPVWS